MGGADCFRSFLQQIRELLQLIQHFETFYLNLKSESQSEGELGTIGNFLANEMVPDIQPFRLPKTSAACHLRSNARIPARC